MTGTDQAAVGPCATINALEDDLEVDAGRGTIREAGLLGLPIAAQKDRAPCRQRAAANTSTTLAVGCNSDKRLSAV